MKGFIDRRRPRTKAELELDIHAFWDGLNEVRCTRYIDHVFKVAPVCVLMGGNSTGDFPGRIFKERSYGKSFSYFCQQLQDPIVHDRAMRLFARSVDRVSDAV